MLKGNGQRRRAWIGRCVEDVVVSDVSVGYAEIG
jgi:hypothetical protein